MWFTEYGSNRIGRINPAGKISRFDLPIAESGPCGIAGRADGTLWVALYNVEKLSHTRLAAAEPTAVATPTATESPVPTATPRLSPSPTPQQTPGACVGDCDGDGSVTVDEVIRGVSIGLGTTAIETCATFDTNADGAVTVDELITAVTRALEGC